MSGLSQRRGGAEMEVPSADFIAQRHKGTKKEVHAAKPPPTAPLPFAVMQPCERGFAASAATSCLCVFVRQKFISAPPRLCERISA